MSFIQGLLVGFLIGFWTIELINRHFHPILRSKNKGVYIHIWPFLKEVDCTPFDKEESSKEYTVFIPDILASRQVAMSAWEQVAALVKKGE